MQVLILYQTKQKLFSICSKIHSLETRQFMEAVLIYSKKMTNPFFTQTCTISSFAEWNVNGELQKQYTAVYTNIACTFYKVWTKIVDNWSVRESQVWDIKVMIEWDKVNVKKDYRLSLSDASIWALWDYLIMSVKPNRFASGLVRSIELTCKKL